MNATTDAEVRRHLKRNTLVQLAHGMFGQTGFRLVSAPTFLPAYLFMLSGSDVVVGLARSLQAAGTIATPMVGASLIAHRRKILGMTLAASALMRLQILGLALVGFLAGSSPEYAGMAVTAVISCLTLMGIFQGIAQVTMNSLRAKVIPIYRRGIIGGARQFLAGLTSAAVSYVAGAYLIDGNALGNGYGAVFLLAFGVASIGLFALALTWEPKAQSVRGRESLAQTLRGTGRLLRQQDDFRRYFIVRALASSGRMALPFYILFAGARMDLTGTVLGALTTVWMLTSSTANLGWGWLGDRYGHRVVMLITLGAWMVSHVQLLFVDSFLDMAAFFVVMGAASGGFNQSAQNLVLELGRPEDIPIRLAASGSAVNVVGAIGPALGGGVVAAFGYVALFLTTAALQLVSFAMMVAYVAEPRSVRAGASGDKGGTNE